MSTAPQPRQQAELLYDQALDLVVSGDPVASAAKFREAFALDPTFHDALHGLIRAYKEMGNYDLAVAAAHQLIACAPEDVLAHTSLSILYQNQGKIAEAEAEALKAKLLGWKLEIRESREADPGE